MGLSDHSLPMNPSYGPPPEVATTSLLREPLASLSHWPLIHLQGNVAASHVIRSLMHFIAMYEESSSKLRDLQKEKLRRDTCVTLSFEG